MNFPNRIPIERIEDYHTHFLGETMDHKLFWGYETFVFTRKIDELNGEDWRKFRREYAVLHIFTLDGDHIETRYLRVEDSFDPNRTTSYLYDLVEELGPVIFRDIEVQLFMTIIDEVKFGLIPNEEFGGIELQPSSTIAFFAPWDGSYDT